MPYIWTSSGAMARLAVRTDALYRVLPTYEVGFAVTMSRVTVMLPMCGTAWAFDISISFPCNITVRRETLT